MSPAEPPSYLAIDLGAESGRAVVGTVTGSAITVETRHRFPNRPLHLPDRLAWNIGGLFDSILAGIAASGRVRSLAIDGWGVDFGLLRDDGSLVALPRSYRDPLTEGVLPRLFELVDSETLFDRTGIQNMEINTLSQLVAMRLRGLRELDQARRLLFIPDLLHHWLGADQVAEWTNATTSQFVGLDGEWAQDILERCGVTAGMMPPMVPPGTVVGGVAARVGDGIDATKLPIVAVTSHDTAAAIVGAPLGKGSAAAYISSGTWSLVGLELAKPETGATARRYNLSNEGGYAGATDLLRNVMGMWLVQRCRSRWALVDGFETAYADLIALAAEAPAFGPVIDPDDASLLRQDDMPDAIGKLCERSDGRAPQTRGEILRVILESLALRYRWTLEALAEATGTRPKIIHVVGGGSSNHLLNAMTASATGTRVIAGPVEATALGNVVVQAIADGEIGSVSEGRQLIARSLPWRSHDPSPDDRWEEAYERFLTLPTVDPVAPHG